MEDCCGAQDCNSFLQSEFTTEYPPPDSITYEGAFKQHYFSIPPTKDKTLSLSLFPLSSPDPISGVERPMLCMGMASKFDGAGLRNLGGRPPIELVFALDISGSMSSSFDILDEKKKREGNVGKERKRIQKLEAAKEALIGLIDTLKEGDSFGLITFNHEAQEIIPLQPFNETLRLQIKEKVKGITSRGGTSLEIAANASVAQYGPDLVDQQPHGENDRGPEEEEEEEEKRDHPTTKKKQLPFRRIFFLTDMLLNERNSAGLLEIYRGAAERKQPIHSTVIGFGFDFDVSLTESLATVPGCNYFTVTDPNEFLHQMTWEFDYLVFPIASNLRVSLVDQSNSSNCSDCSDIAQVVAVCGSPTPISDFDDRKTLMFCSTLFASQTQGKEKEGTKGGVLMAVLSFLEKEEKKKERSLRLKIEFTSFDGEKIESFSKVTFPNKEENREVSPPSSGSEFLVRKTLLISQIVCLIKSILRDIQRGEQFPSVKREEGLPFQLIESERKRKEKDNSFGMYGGGSQSTRLFGSRPLCLENYQSIVGDFLAYYKKEESLLEDFGLAVWRSSLERFFE